MFVLLLTQDWEEWWQFPPSLGGHSAVPEATSHWAHSDLRHKYLGQLENRSGMPLAALLKSVVGRHLGIVSWEDNQVFLEVRSFLTSHYHAESWV